MQFTWASVCWFVNSAFLFVCIRLMALQAPPPALEVLALAGYSFVGYSVAIPCGWALGRSLGWYTAWLYTSLCLALFLIRMMQQVARHDAAHDSAPLSAGAYHGLPRWHVASIDA